jgi:hypothetical protein
MRAMASKSLRNVIFCRLVRRSPSRLLYHHVKGQEGFAPSDSIVTVHKVMKVDFTERSVLVDIASFRYDAHATTQNMALSLTAFPVDALVRVRFWGVHSEEQLHYLVDEDVVGDVVPDECRGVVSDVLSDIFEGRAIDPQLGSAKAFLLETFEDICLLTQGEEGKVQLTSKGQECLRVCCRLINPRQVAASRTLPISELTV